MRQWSICSEVLNYWEGRISQETGDSQERQMMVVPNESTTAPRVMSLMMSPLPAAVKTETEEEEEENERLETKSLEEERKRKEAKHALVETTRKEEEK